MKRGTILAVGLSFGSTVPPWVAARDSFPQPRSAPGRELSRGMESAKLYGNMNKYAYYFTDLLIGSPVPQRTSVIVDTGSRLVGFPCRGCEHCGNHIDPAYDIAKSETARWLKCGESCTSGCEMGRCAYRETYSEGSSIAGQWFDDLVELDGSLKHNAPVHTHLGCHNKENKLFYTQRANGIMGLAPSSDGINGSRPTVLQDLFKDKRHVSTEIFSMCLATWGGRLTVGGFDESFHVPGETIQWTPMRAEHYYFAFPEGISLVPAAGTEGPVKEVVPQSNSQFGITIIDSGTTYSYFPGPIYRKMVQDITTYCAFHEDCGAVADSDDCWRVQETSAGPVKFPILRVQFQGNAQVEWEPEVYLHERGERGIWCYTFMENNLYQTVLGISWMLHKDVVFDIAHSRIGFAKAYCPEHHQESDYLQRNSVFSTMVNQFQDVGRRPLKPLLLGSGFFCLLAAAVSWIVHFTCEGSRPSRNGGNYAASPRAEAADGSSRQRGDHLQLCPDR